MHEYFGGCYFDDFNHFIDFTYSDYFDDLVYIQMDWIILEFSVLLPAFVILNHFSIMIATISFVSFDYSFIRSLINTEEIIQQV